MARQIRCPSCGGEHTLVNPGISMVVCQYCRATVYWDEESALKLGAQSILPEADTRLYLHATGRLLGRGFTVEGHLRYDHGRGTWDEWYLQLEDGSVAWLSESERQLTLEQATRADAPIAAPSQLRVGQPIGLDQRPYTIRELGTATCIGGEGQLPFAVLPGSRYAYADLASLDGLRFASVEFEQGDRPACFVGHVLQHDQLALDQERPPSKAGARSGRDIRCTNCRASLQVPENRPVQTKVCEYCGAQLDLTTAQANVLGVNPVNLKPPFAFAVGQAATFSGVRYEVCGRMLYEDAEHYRTVEYLLHHPEQGYQWLVEEEGHYLLMRPTQEAPQVDPVGLPAKRNVRVGPVAFRKYEEGTVSLVYVDGALPWLAKSGDRFYYVDLIAPPRIFGVERDGAELEYFHGRYVPVAEVWTAFGLDEVPPRPRGIHAAQPFERGPVAKLLMLVGGVFALLNLGLLVWSLGHAGHVLLAEDFDSEQFQAETVSRTFQVGGEKIMSLQLHSFLNNQWLGIDLALMNEKDEVVEEADAEVSYYSGVEGGESWSEGSRHETVYIKAPPPGTYRLLLRGQGGSGEAAGPLHQQKLTVTITQGEVLSRYFLVLAGFAFLFPLYEWLRRFLFEKRRWAPVMPESDDDD